LHTSQDASHYPMPAVHSASPRAQSLTIDGAQVPTRPQSLRGAAVATPYAEKRLLALGKSAT